MKKLIFLLTFLTVAVYVSAADRVEQWARYETSFKAKTNGNPFDVGFTATFTCADTAVTVNGFYDGGGVFKVRFMPMRQGRWTYTTSSTEPTLNGKTGSFSCVAATEENHGPVTVDGLYNFKYADGTRYYPVGTTAYDWMHVAGDRPDTTVMSLAKARFNKIRMLFFVQNFEPTYPEPEQFPFEIKSVGKDDKGKLVYTWDYEHFNPAYFANVERCIDKLAAAGIEADLILFHPYDDGRWNFDRMPQNVNLRYIRYLTARLSSFRNVWWSMANEYDFFKHWKPEVWDTLTAEVVKNDPYRHLCSIHSSTAKYYAYWKPEFTHVSVQDQAPVEDFGRAATVRNIYKKPVVFDEVCYEGNMTKRWGNLSGQEMLRRMWLGFLAGTYVGHGECYVNGNTGYEQDFLAVGGKFHGECWKRIGFMRDILDALPNPLMLADSSWDSYTSTAGDGYYLIYFGKEAKSKWTFCLPYKNAAYPRLKGGERFKVEVIDTWNMTITPCKQTFETTAPIDYRVYDKQHGYVSLPDAPYLMLRITKIK